MELPTPLLEATLIRRYKRFLADVTLPDSEVTTVHTPNTGSMMGCAEPGSRIWISHSGNGKRKYPYSWEVTETLSGAWVSVNTARANALVREAIDNGVMAELQGYDRIRPEVRFGAENSRADFLLEGEARPACYVEVKNVTAAIADQAVFPDAVSTRGSKHLRELMGVVEAGQRGVLVFCVARDDVAAVRPADEIDATYAETLRRAVAAGVEVIGYQVEISATAVRLRHAVPVCVGSMVGGAV